jgi:hypothetical protein
MTDKQKQQVFRKTVKAIEHIDKTIESIRKMEDKVSYESPEYHLMCSATCFLSDARGELVILANRNKTAES